MKTENSKWADAVLAVELAMAAAMMGGMAMLRVGWGRVGTGLARLRFQMTGRDDRL